jgi:polysaccharide biosynthesis transport protein
MVASNPQTDDSVDLREYIAVLSRRKWLILAFTALFTGLALAYSLTATPVYTGLTEVLLQPQAADAGGLRPDQLVSLDTEARVVTSAEVAQPVINDMGLDITIPAILKRVSVEATPDTLVLDIMFTAGSPQQAAVGANQFAEKYLDFKRKLATDVLTNQKELIDSQRETVRTKLSVAQARLDGLSESAPGYQDALQDRDTLQSNLDLLDLQRLQIPPLPDEAGTIILPAEPPTHPSSPNHKLNLAMGLVLGLFIGVVVAFVRDRINDKVGDRGDLESLTTVLATIPRAVTGNERSVLVTEAQPRSPAAEAYRSLRTSVMALRRQSGDSVFAIASPVLGDGKSTTTANLAAALSHADKRVLVVSADLRRPSLHRFFGKPNDIGLTDVLLGEARFSSAIQTVSPSLVLLTSGSPPARPAEILQSQAMREMIRRERDRYDFILIDCPPVLGITDTVAVAPFVDSVILVARAEKTKRSLFVESMDSLAQVGAVLGGAVINDIATARGTYAYGYGTESEDKHRFRRKSKSKSKSKSKRVKQARGSTPEAAGPTGPRRPVEDAPITLEKADGSPDGADGDETVRTDGEEAARPTTGTRPPGRSGA